MVLKNKEKYKIHIKKTR